MAEARDFIFGTHSLGLPRPTIKPHPEKKWMWPWVRKAPIYLGFPFNISATAALLALAELLVVSGVAVGIYRQGK